MNTEEKISETMGTLSLSRTLSAIDSHLRDLDLIKIHREVLLNSLKANIEHMEKLLTYYPELDFARLLDRHKLRFNKHLAPWSPLSPYPIEENDE